MDNKLKNYHENTEKPWSKLFYKMVWYQLGNQSSKNILDFGSGFGITANHLAANNTVTAIEPNIEMIEARK